MSAVDEVLAPALPFVFGMSAMTRETLNHTITAAYANRRTWRVQ